MNRTEISMKLSQYICETLLHNPSYPLQEDERLVSGGLIDSFSLIQLSIFIEDTFQVRIPDTEFTVEVMDTLKGMVDCVIRYAKAGKQS